MERFTRQLTPKLNQLAGKYPFVTITGPRQSGKSTIAQMSFPEYKVVSLEDIDMRLFAKEDPRGFISTFPGKVIIDEVQRVPSLLSYLQTYADGNDEEGLYVLTGSQNFLLSDAIDQTLAGRTALLKLLPLSIAEMRDNNIILPGVNERIFYGGYPRIFAKDIEPNDFYPNYISTYVERDVRQSLSIGNIEKFTKFLMLCAGRIGQLLNKSSLATEAGVSVTTIDAWLSILEASYIIFLLRPYHENFTKRLVKSPVLYFYDTGLACSLLRIYSADQLATHYLRGHLFENLVINEFYKHYFNLGVQPSLWFWRDAAGHEVDLVDTTGGKLNLYEIKSGETARPEFFAGFESFAKASHIPPTLQTVIYGGDTLLNTSRGRIINLDGLQI